MLVETSKSEFAPIEIPNAQRSPLGFVKIILAVVLIASAIWAWQAGYRPALFASSTKWSVAFIEIGEGDIDVSVVETGSIESANNAPIRCQVEALIGTVGGAQGGAAGKGASGAGGGGQGGAGGASGQAGGSGGGQAGSGGGSTSKSKSSSKKKSGGSSKAGSSGASKTSGSASGSGGSGSGGGSSSSSSGGSGSSSSSGSGSSSSSSAAGTGSTTTSAKPVLRSFTYSVMPHTPLRPVVPKTADSAAKKQTGGGQGGGGGGGGGRGGGGGGRGGGGGGRGGGGGGMLQDEKPGSTRIVSIVPQGTSIKEGEVVCELDAAAFNDEEKAQQIRFVQAKSYVEQARSILEVNEITLREYRDGVLPQDMQLIRQYIQTCQIEKDRGERNLKWSRDMLKLGFRTPFQVRGDFLALEQATIAFDEANGMLQRLKNFTGPKIVKTLEANLEAIKSDKLTQDAAYELEKTRLERIRKNITNCIVRAPRDGIVVYANQTDMFGRASSTIDQGVTLRQDQPIFNLPDPQHMRVKARINESKFPLVQTGQPVLIMVDAFPEHPLKGTVAEITPISIALQASDVRVYYANVRIEQGFAELRPGLSAQIAVRVDSRSKVRRIPIEAVRWVGDRSFVALFDSSPLNAGQQPWRWQPVELGVSDAEYAEILDGLKIGDRVVANPGDLPAPDLKLLPQAATNVVASGM